MKLWHLLLLVPLLLNCPKQLVPKVEKIEVIYLSSLYEDLNRKEPILAGVSQSEGIKIGHLVTDPPFMAILLARLGFYELLDKFSIDFIITDSLIYGMNYFSIQKSMGYGISNYKNIRFAVVSKDKDSLTISDEIEISLVKQRSDVLWIIDNAVLNLPPMKVVFRIKNREVADTSITSIIIKTDTVLLKKLQNFKRKLDELLSKRIYLENYRLDDYVFSQIALNKGVNIILYPEGIFRDLITEDSISIDELINKVSCEFKFTVTEMTKQELLKFSDEKGYGLWGGLMKNNVVMIPVEDAVGAEGAVGTVGAVSNDTGEYLFDLFYNED